MSRTSTARQPVSLNNSKETTVKQPTSRAEIERLYAAPAGREPYDQMRERVAARDAALARLNSQPKEQPMKSQPTARTNASINSKETTVNERTFTLTASQLESIVSSAVSKALETASASAKPVEPTPIRKPVRPVQPVADDSDDEIEEAVEVPTRRPAKVTRLPRTERPAAVSKLAWQESDLTPAERKALAAEFGEQMTGWHEEYSKASRALARLVSEYATNRKTRNAIGRALIGRGLGKLTTEEELETAAAVGAWAANGCPGNFDKPRAEKPVV
jgi:hypothetical protein